MNQQCVYLVFGDLHGRILPAFQFAKAWSQWNETPLAGLLQVGDLGYFPDINKIDKATLKHAKDDPLELGTLDIITPNALADQVFHSTDFNLWFTSGNHEDFDQLEALARAAGRANDFAVDAYLRVRGIRDGRVMDLPGGCRVGAIWGVDGESENRRKKLPPRGYIHESSVTKLSAERFDVLLTHDCHRDAMIPTAGSEYVQMLLELAKPRFHFFGHYKGPGHEVPSHTTTRSYFMTGFEMRGNTDSPESGSVGVLEWGEEPTFEFVPRKQLSHFRRENWKKW
ncbi:MAG: metallophosphoesterase [Fimbriiglobus sp.]